MRRRSEYVVELDRSQGLEFFDREARAKLGLSAAEFLRRHDAGTLDRFDQAVLDVEILIPFAREVPHRGDPRACCSNDEKRP